MKLRNHPLISYREVPSWPPTWLWRGGKNRPRPYGEVGILKEVTLSTIEPCSMCFLIMEHEGAEYMVILKFGGLFVLPGHSRRADETLQQTYSGSRRH
jgi:hypothetical protein